MAPGPCIEKSTRMKRRHLFRKDSSERFPQARALDLFLMGAENPRDAVDDDLAIKVFFIHASTFARHFFKIFLDSGNRIKTLVES